MILSVFLVLALVGNMPDSTTPGVDPTPQRIAILRSLATGSTPGYVDPSIPPLADAIPDAAPAKVAKGASPWAKLMYAGGIGADVGSTLAGFAHNHPENDPLINFAGNKAAIPIGLGEEAAVYLLAKKLLGDRHPDIMNAILATSGLAHGAAAGSNIHGLVTQPLTPPPMTLLKIK